MWLLMGFDGFSHLRTEVAQLKVEALEQALKTVRQGKQQTEITKTDEHVAVLLRSRTRSPIGRSAWQAFVSSVLKLSCVPVGLSCLTIEPCQPIMVAVLLR